MAGLQASRHSPHLMLLVVIALFCLGSSVILLYNAGHFQHALPVVSNSVSVYMAGDPSSEGAEGTSGSASSTRQGIHIRGGTGQMFTNRKKPDLAIDYASTGFWDQGGSGKETDRSIGRRHLPGPAPATFTQGAGAMGAIVNRGESHVPHDSLQLLPSAPEHSSWSFQGRHTAPLFR